MQSSSRSIGARSMHATSFCPKLQVFVLKLHKSEDPKVDHELHRSAIDLITECRTKARPTQTDAASAVLSKQVETLCHVIVTGPNDDQFLEENLVPLQSLVQKCIEWLPPIPSAEDALARLPGIQLAGQADAAVSRFGENSKQTRDYITGLDGAKLLGNVALTDLVALLSNGLPDKSVEPFTAEYVAPLGAADAVVMFIKRLHGKAEEARPDATFQSLSLLVDVVKSRLAPLNMMVRAPSGEFVENVVKHLDSLRSVILFLDSGVDPTTRLQNDPKLQTVAAAVAGKSSLTSSSTSLVVSTLPLVG